MVPSVCWLHDFGCITRHITSNRGNYQMTKFNRLIIAAGMLCLPGVQHAATSVNDTFDADIGTWIQNTTDTTVSHQAAGGNPGGYLETNNFNATSNFNVIGAQNTAPDYSGVFADGVWTIDVDLSFINGDFTEARLRFRFQDPTANGWYIPIEDSDFFNSPWQSYSVTFDTTWDDATAMANGWVKEADGTTPTPSFSGLWDDVYNSEVRILGGPRMVAGIDNYMATYVPVPAAVWLFASGLLGLIGVSRRRKV